MTKKEKIKEMVLAWVQNVDANSPIRRHRFVIHDSLEGKMDRRWYASGIEWAYQLYKEGLDIEILVPYFAQGETANINLHTELAFNKFNKMLSKYVVTDVNDFNGYVTVERTQSNLENITKEVEQINKWKGWVKEIKEDKELNEITLFLTNDAQKRLFNGEGE